MSQESQRKLDALVARLRAPDVDASTTNGHAPQVEATVSDEEIIAKCRASRNSQKFEALFDRGDTSGHNHDDSAADLALLGILKFYSQDPAQLERIFSGSALGHRKKWTSRSDYREKTIAAALRRLGEVYDWSRDDGRSRPMGTRELAALAASPYIQKAAGAAGENRVPPLELIQFSKRPKPKKREFVIPELVPRYHPTTLYGWGGTAKSLIAVLLAMSVAAGRKMFLGRAIDLHGPVLYVDFELDPDEQHRRVDQLAAGLGIGVPDDMYYVSTLGRRTHEAVGFALKTCEERQVVLVVLDSLGPAMVGDMSAAKDVIGFHNAYIQPFKSLGVTPILVDHQARQQAGEGYQNKGAFGSAYKEHLSRSLIQVERGDQSAEEGLLNVRIRHKKTNFGALVDPFDVEIEFDAEEISIETRELVPSERAQEGTLNSKERVTAALEDGPAYRDELVEATGLSASTVKNAITALKKAGVVVPTGEVRGQMEQVELAALAAPPIKGKAVKAASVAKDPNQTILPAPSAPAQTVTGLFSNPPDWLRKQLGVYRHDPTRHLQPLCAVVAAEVYGDPARASEVREEVKRLAGV